MWLWMTRFREYGRMIKFSHSVFLLPFAFSALLLAPSHVLTVPRFLWILLALVSARSAAMGFNRIADRDLDAANPRTAARALPQGRIGLKAAWVFVAASCVVFLLCAWALSPLALALSPLALAFVLAYSFSKRFTWASHLWLGLGAAMAPAGAWIAVTGAMDGRAGVLVAAVALWVAGFDILYACQDAAFDRERGLLSIPARLGVGPALWAARGLHLLSVLGLLWVGRLFGMGLPYWAGVGVVGLLLSVEHALVSEKDLSRINEAFFTVNGLVSVLYLAAVFLDRRVL
jgi:4-hydroxybenzoate polyprenyltransferase